MWTASVLIYWLSITNMFHFLQILRNTTLTHAVLVEQTTDSSQSHVSQKWWRMLPLIHTLWYATTRCKLEYAIVGARHHHIRLSNIKAVRT